MSLKPLRSLSLSIVAALLTGCGPDYTPIGDGLKAIGICIVVSCVVAALADLIKGERSQSTPPPAKRPRKRTGTNQGEED